jgi:hypothetical protein
VKALPLRQAAEPISLQHVNAPMPRFYFHLFNDTQVPDPEGTELPDATVAIQRAVTAARAMAAESVREGRLVLSHRIEISDETGASVGTVHFGDVVEIQASENG